MNDQQIPSQVWVEVPGYDIEVWHNQGRVVNLWQSGVQFRVRPIPKVELADDYAEYVPMVEYLEEAYPHDNRPRKMLQALMGHRRAQYQEKRRRQEVERKYSDLVKKYTDLRNMIGALGTEMENACSAYAYDVLDLLKGDNNG